MVKRVEHCETSKCPVACSLDIIGDHWTLLIIRSMMLMGCHEYKDLLGMPEGISSNILSDRLKKLEESGIINSAAHLDSKRRKLYYLTQKGRGLLFVILEIAKWADLYIPELIDIPDEKRPFIDLPSEEIGNMVFAQLDKWEAENLIKT